MKKIVCSLLLVLTMTQLNAQDIVVTAKGDTLNCYVKPQKVGDKYEVAVLYGKVLKWVKLKENQVTKVERGFYLDNPTVTQAYLDYYSFPRLTIGVDIGYGYQFVDLDRSSSSFYSVEGSAPKGVVVNLDVSSFKYEHLGFGFAYYGHFASGDGASYSYRNYSNKSSIHSFLPTITYRSFSVDRCNVFYLKYGLGILSYDNHEDDNEDFNKLGLATSLSIGYDFRMSKHTAFGLKLSVVAGHLKPSDDFHSSSKNIAYVAFSTGLHFVAR